MLDPNDLGSSIARKLGAGVAYWGNIKKNGNPGEYFFHYTAEKKVYSFNASGLEEAKKKLEEIKKIK
jgi:hypothetical protein